MEFKVIETNCIAKCENQRSVQSTLEEVSHAKRLMSDHLAQTVFIYFLVSSLRNGNCILLKLVICVFEPWYRCEDKLTFNVRLMMGTIFFQMFDKFVITS